MTEDEATHSLREAGINAKQRYEKSATVPSGDVIRIAPEAGVTTSMGGTVNMVISLGCADVRHDVCRQTFR